MPSENLILPFAPTDTGTNLMADPAYAADAQRLIGNQPGVARAALVNKALRQSSLLSAGLAQFLADFHETNINDGMTPAALAALIEQAIIDIATGGTPLTGYETPGMVAYFPVSAPPAGWLRSNGAYLSRTTYAALFDRIGTTFGFNDSTDFRLPDLRGEFIRGWDDSRGVDSGRTLGSFQEATHVVGDNGSSIGTHAPANMTQVNGDPGDGNARLMSFVGTAYTNTTTDLGSNGGYWRRVRPRNIALLACIKF